MNMLAKVHKDIGKAKERLESQPMHENFGQDEVRKLRERYDMYALSEINVNERNQILDAIDYFDNWCQTYTKSDYDRDMER